MILLIDNYDSFTYNLAHLIGAAGGDIVVRRNDDMTAEEARDMLLARQGAAALVVSPGPCTPNEAGVCLDLLKLVDGAVPTLGVCLGHQAIGQVYGGEIVRAGKLMHGKTSVIRHTGDGIFEGLPQDFTATRYHSLVVKPDSVPDVLAVTATSPDGQIMGVAHRTKPVFGVQFHPESIASEHGERLVANFLSLLQKKAA
ncbi:MAG: aminodeoxychorismate/anthranilate synthase component II [Pseudomonadota bacterium]